MIFGRKRSSNSRNVVSDNRSGNRSSTPETIKPWTKTQKVNLTFEDLDAGDTEPFRVQKARRKIDAVVHNEILRKPKSPNKNDDDSSSAQDTRPRRGRKRERDDKYFVNAVQKINRIKNTLKAAREEGLTVQDR